MGVAETYANYMPSKLKIGSKHPDPVVESTSLSSVEPVDVWYELIIPKTIISSGALSALQLEAITYACQQHEVILPSGMRGGFLIGDGAGVGKGRTIAGLIYENYLRGRKKSIWISVMNDLKYDSERDLNDIGADIAVHHLNKMKYCRINSAQNGNLKKGVLFCTYSALIAQTLHHNTEFENRLDQIVEWCGPNFDGIIVFDECHRAKNLCPSNSGKATKTGLKVLQLQECLPLARVVYASATGATEPRNMAYMIRLNMWGPGTPYPDFNVFLNVLQKRGVGAMEIVAMDMKLRGLYIARQLSFHGVIFKIVEVPLSKSFITVYNKATKLWTELLSRFHYAVNIMNADKSMKTYIWGQFWSAHQRFFRYMCISAKVSQAVLIAREAIKCGKCVVIGLQSTGEARTLSQLGKDDAELSDFVSTAHGVLLSLVENHFPTSGNQISNKVCDQDKYTTSKTSQNSNKRKKMKFSDSLRLKTSDEFSDSESDDDNAYSSWFSSTNSVSDSPGTKLAAIRKELLKKIEKLGKCLPPNALDELIDELGGPDNVAEMTGRKGRVVHNDGSFKYETRSVNDVPLEILNLREKQRFMDGEKDVAIISEAASSGISLHSDKRAINKRCRVHITLELPWSADRAIQQFGRTHRSNQSNAPEYVLLISELGGERRFASVVAKRLESLGALTQGDRRATEARDLSKYNIDNNYGRAAVELTLKSIIGQEKPLVDAPADYAGNFMKDALHALTEVGLISQSESNSNAYTLECDRKTFGKFLNRILGIRVELQNALFSYFTNTMEAITERAKKFGHYDLGILDVAAEDKFTKRIQVNKYQRKELNGTVTIELHKVSVERGMCWEDAFNLWSRYSGFKDGFYCSIHQKTRNKEIILAILEKSSRERHNSYGSEEDLYTVYRPNVGQQLKKETMKNILKRYKATEMDEAERLWISHYEASLFTCSHEYWNGICKRSILRQECDVGFRNKTYYILSGSVLSIWNSLESIISYSNGSRLQVVRVKTKDGEKIVGTLIPSSCVHKLHNHLQSTAISYTTKQF
ncbi:hypothetical protein O3M35_002384 [Rhynocoris fuscipes]|uniref:Uncharacterized protein n=1 Tax=Rhynocoris fuscipes TaxID=488301 RepID=A0AAW1CLQ1_9HEMI